MLINTDLSSESSLANRQNVRAAAAAPAAQTTSAPAASQLDSYLTRLADNSVSSMDHPSGIQDEEGAGQAMEFLRGSITGRPAAAISSQANLSSQNVLGLLQAAD